MMVIFTCGLLALSFIVHLLWWRIKMPVQSSRALLMIFFVVPMIVIGIYLNMAAPSSSISLAKIISLILLYVSCSLVYISLYSAIEQYSPTIEIITHINSHEDEGCDDQCILQHVKPCEEISKRLAIMTQVKWVSDDDGVCSLTKRGRRIAFIFNCGASVIGLEKGG